MLENLKIMEDKLIDMFFTCSILKKIKNANCKGYVRDVLKNKFKNEDPCHVEAIQKIKTEEPKEAIAEKVPIESNEKVKEGKVLKVLTLNKLLTSFPILLGQIKVENNSYKQKNEIRQILYLLYQHNKITKKVYNSLIESL